MTSTNATVVELRTFLTELDEPDEAAWAQVCEVVDAVEGPDLSVVLDYLVPHTDKWPEWIRVAPEPWTKQFVEGTDDPRMRLVGTIFLMLWGNDDAIIGRLAQSPHFAGLRQLYVEEGELSDLAVAALIGSPHLAGLQTLHVLGRDITDDSAEAIASCHWNLLSLSIHSGSISDLGVQHLATGSATRNLEFLGLSENYQVSDEGGLLLVKSLPKLQSLDLSMTMVGVDGDELPMYIYEHQDELALVDCDLGDMWEVDADVREELAYRYNMILE